MLHTCTHTDTHAPAHLRHTHHTHPLIVTDRAERAAFSHHDESLARKKNGGREAEELTGERRGLRGDNRARLQEDVVSLMSPRGFCSGSGSSALSTGCLECVVRTHLGWGREINPEMFPSTPFTLHASWNWTHSCCISINSSVNAPRKLSLITETTSGRGLRCISALCWKGVNASVSLRCSQLYSSQA